MGEISQQIKNADGVNRFYVECKDCGAKVLDSARTNIPAGWSPGLAESMAKTTIRGHADQSDIIHVDGKHVELHCDSFEVVIETVSESQTDPIDDSDIDVGVTVK